MTSEATTEYYEAPKRSGFVIKVIIVCVSFYLAGVAFNEMREFGDRVKTRYRAAVLDDILATAPKDESKMSPLQLRAKIAQLNIDNELLTERLVNIRFDLDPEEKKR